MFFNLLSKISAPSLFLVTAIVTFGIPMNADAKWKWKTIPADEAVLKLKGWPTPIDQCLIRKAMSPSYSKENTAINCPRWVGSEEPRTYFRVVELMPGYYWAAGYGVDFSEHPIFTKVKGNWFKYFKNPTIKPGQKTKCYSDDDCSFQRIEFSVKGRECQWSMYKPDLGNTDGLSGRSETPYSLEIFTCQTSVPITKEHIEMKPGKVTVTFPGGSNSSDSVNSGSLPSTRNDSSEPKRPTSTRNADSQTALNSPAPSGSILEKRPIAIQWEGKDSLLSGHVTIPKSGAGNITFSVPETDSQCSGTFAYTKPMKGIWSAACTTGETASGSFKVLGAGKGSTGTGKDNKGRTVRFTIGAR